MTEKNYRISIFNEKFERFREKRIVLYGIGNNTQAILKHYGTEYNFIGVTTENAKGAYWNGYRVLPEREIIELHTDLIVIAAQISSADAIYERIFHFCVENNILLFDMYGNNAILIHQDITRQQAFYFQKCADEFMTFAENYDIISFDLLGTFLISRFYSELQLYQQVEDQVAGKYHFQNFVSNRWKAKQSGSVYNIEHVYEQLQQYEGLNSTEREKLAEIETDINLKNVFVRNTMLDIYKQLKKKGKKIVFVSDWYLNAIDQEKFLQSAGINDYDGLYVQSAQCGFKRSGLFRKLKSDFPDYRILHVGDDRLDDWLAPKMYDIDTYVLYSPFETMQVSTFALEREPLEDEDNWKTVQEFILEAFSNPFVLYGTNGEWPLSDKAKRLFSQIRRKGKGGTVPITYKPVLLNLDKERRNILEVPKFEKIEVSIIIPVYNQFDYTFLCIQSIVEHSEDVSYEIILADDCSTDDVRNIENVIHNITVIHNRENLRFLRNCNNAANKAKGKYILFLNNDTQVQPGWLSPLIELMERDEEVGMVGSKLVYPNGRLQEAGGILWKDGSAWNYGNNQDPEASEFNYVKEVDYISGAAIMIRKELWEEIGGFDERYVPAYCEDADLAFEVRRHGKKVVYQPKSVVVHFEGISNGTDTSSGQKSYQVINQKKLLDKWKECLTKEHFLNGTNVFQARDRSAKKPKLLMINSFVPMYDKDAGSRTLFQYLQLFVEKGFSITLLGDNFYRHEPYTSYYQSMGIEVLYGAYYANNWKNWLSENGKDIDYVWLNYPHISIKYIDTIKSLTNAKILYYGMDLHYLRLQREYEVSHNEQLLLEAAEWKKKEFYIMRKADMNYTLSDIEIEAVHADDASIAMRRMGIFAYDSFREDIPQKFDKRKDLIFVGGFNHRPNLDAVLWFAKEILPKVKESINVKLYIVGSNPPQELKKLSSDDIIVKGFVSDEELVQLYDSCRIAVVPLRFGAGVKGKVLEAMYNGIPIATTTVGAEGINGIEKIAEINDSANDFARAVIDMYNSPERLGYISVNEQKFVRENLSMDAIWREISVDFNN